MRKGHLIKAPVRADDHRRKRSHLGIELVVQRRNVRAIVSADWFAGYLATRAPSKILTTLSNEFPTKWRNFGLDRGLR
jgi:hypothetical protein